jgi:hypothetical protein
MIGLPLNDGECLGAITELIAGLVRDGDEVLVQLAAQHPTTDSLQGWLRTLPQRDDLGQPNDGPKVEACSPPQRLRIAPSNPNCVERAALYLGVAELIDPRPVRQLGTLDTPLGLHTFPIEAGAPVILDPRVSRNGLRCGVALLAEGPIALDPRAAIEWTTELAETGAAIVRNGPCRVRAARNAIYRLVDQGIPPVNEHEADLIGWLLSLAERAARRYGPRALAIVRSTAQAVSNLADEAIARTNARTNRNLSIEIAGHTIRPAPWTSALGRIAGRVGAQVGAGMLANKLAALGVGKDLISVLQRELAAEGINLGTQPAARARNAHKTSPRTVADVDLPSFALMVEALAGDVEPDPDPDGLARGRFGERIFIAAIRRALRATKYANLSRAAVNELLLRAHQEQLLQLARADLVAAMDPDEVRDSELRADGATFHFVVVDPGADRNVSTTRCATLSSPAA